MGGCGDAINLSAIGTESLSILSNLSLAFPRALFSVLLRLLVVTSVTGVTVALVVPVVGLVVVVVIVICFSDDDIPVRSGYDREEDGREWLRADLILTALFIGTQFVRSQTPKSVV